MTKSIQNTACVQEGEPARTTRKLTPSSSVFDGPLELFDNGHIQTIEHAKLFKTGELKLPGHAGEVVGVEFYNFAMNRWQNRQDAIFTATNTEGVVLGQYFASAFKSLCL